mmetsp:Transcript_20690/g.57459  ORF Transcript_20690/g.57459 Transcript_20690/m.57459 type:complete len:221 (-) Transcript_20690:822-1484(-)
MDVLYFFAVPDEFWDYLVPCIIIMCIILECSVMYSCGLFYVTNCMPNATWMGRLFRGVFFFLELLVAVAIGWILCLGSFTDRLDALLSALVSGNVPGVIAQERIPGTVLVEPRNPTGQLAPDLGKDDPAGSGLHPAPLGKEVPPSERRGHRGNGRPGSSADNDPHRGQKARNAHGEDARNGSQIAGEHQDHDGVPGRILGPLQKPLQLSSLFRDARAPRG